METKKILLEAYKERQQKAAAAGAIPSFYRKACGILFVIVQILCCQFGPFSQIAYAF